MVVLLVMVLMLYFGENVVVVSCDVGVAIVVNVRIVCVIMG